MRDTRSIEGGIRDKNILAGSGYAHFNWSRGIALKLLAGCGISTASDLLKI